MPIVPDLFFFDPGASAYDFGPRHPLRPVRLALTLRVLAHCGIEPEMPPPCSKEELLLVHDGEYVDAIEALDGVELDARDREQMQRLRGLGLAGPDTTAFPGIWKASLAYCAGTVAAARAVLGGASVAFGIAGGLHHARREMASGFCVFNDAAIAARLLLERFSRVAYVDIDLHHGDGVQWLLYDEPRVLTCSIHESGETLFPGTGFLDEVGGAGARFTSLNVPLAAGTTGDVWFEAFRRGVLPAIRRFRAEAIVLQMGADPHFRDPLGHLRCTAREWLQAVAAVKALGLPIVALGGGGYDLQAVPRMWSAGVLTLLGRDLPADLPSGIVLQWENPTLLDEDMPEPRASGAARARAVIDWLESRHHPNVPVP